MFEHFSQKVAESKTHYYYIHTLGFAYSKNKQTNARYLLKTTPDNRVCIDNKFYHLPKLIFKTIYDKRKIHKIYFLDGNKKNFNIENLVNLKSCIKPFDIVVKNNNTGKCKKLTQTEFLRLVKKLDKFKIKNEELEFKRCYLIRTKPLIIGNYAPKVYVQQVKKPTYGNFKNFNAA